MVVIHTDEYIVQPEKDSRAHSVEITRIEDVVYVGTWRSHEDGSTDGILVVDTSSLNYSPSLQKFCLGISCGRTGKSNSRQCITSGTYSLCIKKVGLSEYISERFSSRSNAA